MARNINDEIKGRESTLEAIDKLEAKGLKSAVDRQKVEEEILSLKKERAEQTRQSLSIEQSIINIQDSILGKLKEKFDLEKNIKSIKEGQSSEDPKQREGAKKYAELLANVASGATDLDGVLASIANEGMEGVENFGPFLPLVEKLAEVMQKMPDLGDKIKVEAGVQSKLDAMFATVKGTSEILMSPQLMGVAAFGALVKLAGDFFSNAKDIRQELGLTVGQSAQIGFNLTIGEKALTLMGGRAGEVKSFASGIAAEFGNVGEISTGVALQFAKISAFTGLSGQNAAVLAKQIQIIQGGSLETSLNMIETFDSIARAAGVAPGLVLNDIAQSTKLFAEFAKDGGENIAEAAAHAAKLGINLSTVAGIADSLLNIEQSLTNELEAEVLLGRDLNLDKARELALMGDLEGLQKEITDGLVSQAEFSEMNVIQRRKLAEAIGVSVQDLGKMVAGEQTSAQLAEERQEKQALMQAAQSEMMQQMVQMHGLTVAMLAIDQIRSVLSSRNAVKEAAKAGTMAAQFGFSLGTMVATLAATGLGILAVAPLLSAAYAAVRGGQSLAKAEEGGEITKTGAIMAHIGEVFSGTKNEMGFGADMTVTNTLLKQNIAQLKSAQKENTFYLLQLKKEIGDLKLANA